MSGRKKITVIHCLPASYVKRDIDILRSRYQVVEIWARNLRTHPTSFLSILRHVPGSDLVLGWFADYPTLYANLLAKAFGHKVITIVLGYEVSRMSNLGYGRLLRQDGRYFVSWALGLADRALAVSRFSRQEALANLGPPAARLEVLHHGFPLPPLEKPLTKEALVLTVARVSQGTLKNKGLETFVRSAAYLPQVPFVLLGDWLDDSIHRLRGIASPNVEFVQVGLPGQGKLEEYYRRAKVYVQASLHESFCCSLAEAMSWGCVPVVTHCGALPEVAGDTAFYVEPENPRALAAQIEQALSSDGGGRARERIAREFPLEKRGKALLEMVGEMLE